MTAERLQALTSWYADWKGLRVAVLGLSVTGFSVADTLAELGADVLVVSEHADSAPGERPSPPQHAWLNCQNAMRLYAPVTKIPAPAASPSRPSARLTEFDVATPMKPTHAR